MDLLVSGIVENSRAEIETKRAYREGRIAKGIEPHPGFRLSKASSPSERPRYTTAQRSWLLRPPGPLIRRFFGYLVEAKVGGRPETAACREKLERLPERFGPAVKRSLRRRCNTAVSP